MFGEWTSKCDNRRGMSIANNWKREEIAQIGWLTGGVAVTTL